MRRRIVVIRPGYMPGSGLIVSDSKYISEHKHGGTVKYKSMCRLLISASGSPSPSPDDALALARASFRASLTLCLARR
jgi:hypothetical protein